MHDIQYCANGSQLKRSQLKVQGDLWLSGADEWFIYDLSVS